MIHGLRFFALALALAGSCQASCIPGKDPDRDYPLETYAKNYEKINEYLERKVTSNDLRKNFDTAKKWIEKERSKSSLLRDKSRQKALERFIKLSGYIVESWFSCSHLPEAIEANSEVLANETDTKLARIGKIIDSVESQFLERCNTVPLNSSGIEFSFKATSYDKIDLLLVLAGEPTNMDPDVAMAKVNELLAEKGEGPLGEALQLLVSLKTVDDEGCLLDGYSVVLKNLVAARRSILNRDMPIHSAMRRIDRLVLHYAHRYTADCSYMFPEQLKSLIKQIDTLYRLRVQTKKLLMKSDQVAETQFESEFTKEIVVAYVMSIPEKASLFHDQIIVPCQNYLGDNREFFERFEYHKSYPTESIEQLTSNQVVLSLGFVSYNLCKDLIRQWQEQLLEMQVNNKE